MPKYKIGFIGGGVDSAVGYAHFVASSMDDLWGLEAGVFSRNPEGNLSAAKAYGVAADRVYHTVQEFLVNEKDRLDAVVILTPTPSHFDNVMQCLQAGMAVICEKAMAANALEAKQIHEMCQKKNGFIAVTYNYSGYPMVREMRDIINRGGLGDILHFQAEMPQEGYLREDAEGNKNYPQRWRMEDGNIPTIHLDLAVHLHELIYYLIGLVPEKVIADQSSYGWYGVIDNVTCMARYNGDVQGQFWFSKSALGNRNGLKLRVYGSKASLEWLQMNPEEVLISYSDGRREIIDRAAVAQIANQQRYNRFKAGHPAGFNEALANLYADIYQELNYYKQHKENSTSEVFGSELALSGLEWIEAMVRSCSSKKWEEIHKNH